MENLSDAQALAFFNEEAPLQLLLTKARHEKKVLEALERFGIPVYLPLVKKVKKYKKGRAIHEVPLFSNYVFCHEPGELREKMFAISQHMVSVITVPEASRESLLEELSSIQKILASQAPVEACDELQEGQSVRIKNGQFKDLEGVIVEKRGAMKLVINVEMLGRSIAVEIDPADLKAN
jgi:transcription antitermination factor NusG